MYGLIRARDAEEDVHRRAQLDPGILAGILAIGATARGDFLFPDDEGHAVAAGCHPDQNIAGNPDVADRAAGGVRLLGFGVARTVDAGPAARQAASAPPVRADQQVDQADRAVFSD